MKHAVISKTLLVMMLFLFMSSVAIVNAQPLSSADDGDDTTTETEHEDDDDDDHEPSHDRDDVGTVWIQTNVMTVRLDSQIPSYQYWYTPDENGSLSRFQVSYLMVVEFEDQNGDGVYQINETIQFAPLEAFDWHLKTGAVTDENGTNSEVYASYIKGGLTGEDFDDDWFEDWMPGYGEEDEDSFLLADGDNSTEDDDYPVYETMNLTRFKSMTMQFYAHIYMNDFDGKVKDDAGVQATYTIDGGVELKIDIEIGNFPYLSNTSKVAVLNYLQEDVASDGENHNFELHEDDDDTEIESEDEWEIHDDLGEPFNDVDEEDIQEISLVEATTNTTRGFYRWVDKAVQTLPDGSKTAVDVSTSYWANGKALLLFFAYPNFDGGSVLHDPSMKFVETNSPVPIPTGNPLGEVPLEITLGAAIVGIATIAIVAVVMKRR
ncbi:MAG: hypothetical protein KAR33_08365 [Candidatus Thorarchaeota archaeon]|nr:hypothetical protein [Candidatus Thorarchaeota archaeon]